MADSLKGLIQGLHVNEIKILEGEVVSANPLRITLASDAKMTLGAAALCVPAQIAGDYKAEISLSEQSGGRVMAIIHNTLRVGERVYLISVNSGKKYFVLGRSGQ